MKVKVFMQWVPIIGYYFVRTSEWRDSVIETHFILSCLWHAIATAATIYLLVRILGL